MPSTMSWTYRRSWPNDVRHIADARTFVVDQLHSGGLPDAALVLRLVVSELATNAVLHAATPFSVTISRDDESLRLEVRDDLPVAVALPTTGPNRGPNGRGLRIVDRLSHEWGVDVDHAGKEVWAVFALPLGRVAAAG